MQTKRAMILVSNDPESLRLGANELIQHLTEALVAYDLQNEVEFSTLTNVGTSNILPLVVVYPEATVYGPVKPEDARFLVEEHLYKGRIAPVGCTGWLSGNIGWLRGHKGYNPAEQRIVLERAGRIDPDSIEDFITENGYQALGKALTEMTPEQVIETIEKSGLQGRGGAGFPAGRKWRFVRGTPSEKKYVVCNADESERIQGVSC
jgi:NADP-reducing hydrogenase subunit HndC